MKYCIIFHVFGNSFFRQLTYKRPICKLVHITSYGIKGLYYLSRNHVVEISVFERHKRTVGKKLCGCGKPAFCTFCTLCRNGNLPQILCKNNKPFSVFAKGTFLQYNCVKSFFCHKKITLYLLCIITEVFKQEIAVSPVFLYLYPYL